MDRAAAQSTAPFGSWAWLEATDGIMTVRERLAAVPGLSTTFKHFAVDRARLAIGRKPRHSFGPEELWPAEPDSRLCREAIDEATTLQSAHVLQHGYRTWIFGSALAQIDDVPLDRELFFAGALLHDLGLEHRQPGRCFTYRSAEAARDAGERANIDPSRTLEMMDGIAMHISSSIDRSASVIGYYLQAGAMADLAGIRAWELPADLRALTAAKHPRADGPRILSSCWQAEARDVPGGRAHFADKFGGFSKIVRWLPPK